MLHLVGHLRSDLGEITERVLTLQSRRRRVPQLCLSELGSMLFTRARFSFRFCRAAGIWKIFVEHQ
jgi:hypothetical protein